MREIKFRAWDKTQKHFVYFELFGGVNGHAPDIYEDADLEQWEQYIGLKDRTRKEIYKGDILKDDYYPDNSEHGKEVYVKVSFDNDLLCFKGNIYSDRDGIECEDIFYIHTDSKRLKVIGNIHENPELIK